MTFAQPLWFAALALVPLIWLVRASGHVGFSDSRLATRPTRLARVVIAFPRLVASFLVVFVVAALARPQVPGDPLPRTVVGRDIVVAVDISASMGFEFKGELKKHETPKELEFKGGDSGPRRKKKEFTLEPKLEGNGVRRIDAAQNAILQFIENRWRNQTGDRIGMILFDERPRYGWPLTDDLRMIYRKGQFVTRGLGLGTNFGERVPGPIDLAMEHFKEVGQASSRVLILVSDGEDQMSGYTMQRLAELIVNHNIRLYMIGIGETLARKDVDIIRLSNNVGGKVFRVEDTASLAECFRVIDQMEKSAITVSQTETRNDVFHYFACAALVCLGLLLASQAVIQSR